MARSHNLVRQAQDLFEQVDRENRELTPEERTKAERLLNLALVFGLSDQGHAALELGVPLADAKEATN